jgi:pyrroloquinoline quinone (PQQ) biosynthesis protein C
VKSNSEVRIRLLELMEDYRGNIPIIEAIVSGTLPLEHIRALGTRLYAEARFAIQTKIPERIRLCPVEAGDTRRMWVRILVEESGGFKKGQDHASLIAVTCKELGVTHEQLEAEYANYAPRMGHIQQEEPSLEITVRELTRMYVEEAVLARESNRIGDALRAYYNVSSEDALYYFRLHSVVDIKHSNAALNEITRVATTPQLQDLAIDTAAYSLKHFPIWFN